MLVVVTASQHCLAQANPAPKELRVAAASDLQPVMPVLAAEYEKATGVKLVVSYAASATLTQQILNGAPMDLFLAADYNFPEQVVTAGLADAKAPTPYAQGTLVLWARKDSPLQPITIDSLTDKRVTAIAIADQLHAPYGRAAVSALTSLKLYDTLKPHLVIAENISQTAQFVESGNAQLGLISLTTASTEHFKQVGTYVLVPTAAYPPILQCAVVMAKSDRKDAANAFLKWMLSPVVQSELKGFGLAPTE
jgi:molybdate transport system substrate-binding protein